MTELKQARQEEAKAIAGLLTIGQGLRRLLEVIAADKQVPADLRVRAQEETALWFAGCRRYAEASSARTIARQRTILPGEQPAKRRRYARSKPEEKRIDRDQQ